ncbi:hypothetical protein G6F57_018644 [Rhizopus arrhizus]|nr:hypothetical protein G6F57_018644 [Rhizopus arrhizus]
MAMSPCPARDRNNMSLTMARSRSSSSRLDCITSCSSALSRGRDSATFDLSGDVAGNTIVTGRSGSRDVFDGAQPVSITAQPGQLDANGGNALSLSVNLDASVLPRPASGQAYVSLSSAMVASALYGSLTQGVGLSAADALAAAMQSLQGRGVLLSTDGGHGAPRSKCWSRSKTARAWACRR